MTYLPDSVLVEKVAKAMFHVGYPMTSFAWESSHLKPIYRERARAALSVACPLVAGVIANRLDELFAETGASEAVDHITRLVRREFGEAA